MAIPPGLAFFLLLIASSFFVQKKACAEPSDSTEVRSLLERSSELLELSPSSALRRAEEALAQAKEAKNPFWVGRSRMAMARAYMKSSDYDEALRTAEIAKGDFESAEDVKHKARALALMGEIHDLKGKYPRALDQYVRAKRIQERESYRLDLSKTYRKLGIVFHEKGNYSKAQEFYFKSIRIQKELGAEKQIAKTRINLGNLKKGQGELEEARKRYEQALKTFKELDIPKELATLYGNLGLLHADRGEYEKALEKHQRSLEIKKDLGDRLGIAKTYINIGGVYSELGRYSEAGSDQRKELLAGAEEHHLKALKIAKELDAISIKVGVLSALGRIASLRGEHEEALSHYKEVADLAHRIGSQRREMEARKRISSVLASMGEHAEAYQERKKYESLRDSVIDLKKSKEMGRLQIEHQLAMKELKRKQKERELRRERERRNLLQYSGAVIFIILLLIGVSYAGRFNLSIRFVEGALFFTILLAFEFIMVGITPFLSEYTGNAPLYRLISNVVLALLFFPLLNFMENKIRQRIQKLRAKKS